MFKNIITIDNITLTVSTQTDEFATRLFENWCKDGRVFERISSSPITSVDQVKTILNNNVEKFYDNTQYRWTIIVDDDPIGFVTLTPHDMGDGNEFLEIGGSIGPDFWGMGIMTTVMRELLTHVDNTPVFATVFLDNDTSFKLATKVGLKDCGTVKRKHIYGSDSKNPEQEVWFLRTK